MFAARIDNSKLTGCYSARVNCIHQIAYGIQLGIEMDCGIAGNSIDLLIDHSDDAVQTDAIRLLDKLFCVVGSAVSSEPDALLYRPFLLQLEAGAVVDAHPEVLTAILAGMAFKDGKFTAHDLVDAAYAAKKKDDSFLYATLGAICGHYRYLDVYDLINHLHTLWHAYGVVVPAGRSKGRELWRIKR